MTNDQMVDVDASENARSVNHLFYSLLEDLSFSLTQNYTEVIM